MKNVSAAAVSIKKKRKKDLKEKESFDKKSKTFFLVNKFYQNNLNTIQCNQ